MDVHRRPGEAAELADSKKREQEIARDLARLLDRT
jgi:hypothetical protein